MNTTYKNDSVLSPDLKIVFHLIEQHLQVLAREGKTLAFTSPIQHENYLLNLNYVREKYQNITAQEKGSQF